VAARLSSGDRVEEVEADWLLGCDGAHSSVREQLGISFSGATYPEHFVLADIKVDGGLDHDEAQVWLHRKGALAFFPLPEDRWRLIVTNSPADWHDEPSLHNARHWSTSAASAVSGSPIRAGRRCSAFIGGRRRAFGKAGCFCSVMQRTFIAQSVARA
jgi:2-polyprenyl-6-methoxyphenol hydroxylase-like FAD-dependent oxidoreductase